jgi:hypothetical protein
MEKPGIHEFPEKNPSQPQTDRDVRELYGMTADIRQQDANDRLPGNDFHPVAPFLRRGAVQCPQSGCVSVPAGRLPVFPGRRTCKNESAGERQTSFFFPEKHGKLQDDRAFYSLLQAVLSLFVLPANGHVHRFARLSAFA